MPSAAELEVIALSLRVAAAVVLVVLLPGILCALLLARWRSRWRWLLHGTLMLPLVLPPVVTGYLLMLLLGRSSWLGGVVHAVTGQHIAYTTSACVVAGAVVSFPLLVESVRQSLLGIDVQLEQVARTLGRGRTATFLRVTLPLALPGVLSGASLAFARALGEFGATIVLAGNIAGETRQIPLAVYALLNVPGGESAALRLCAVSVALSLSALGLSSLLLRRQRARTGAS
jgi:molybdate transport system permease protein